MLVLAVVTMKGTDCAEHASQSRENKSVGGMTLVAPRHVVWRTGACIARVGRGRRERVVERKHRGSGGSTFVFPGLHEVPRGDLMLFLLHAVGTLCFCLAFLFVLLLLLLLLLLLFCLF
jgi:hypothetical protein